MNEYELYHHGILGMKWGIRRFQNKDGSLTDAGKKRYHVTTDRPKEYDGTSILKKGTKLSSVTSDLKTINLGGARSLPFKSPNSDSEVYRNRKDRNGDPMWMYTYKTNDKHDSAIYKGPFSVYLRMYRGAATVKEHQFEVVKDLKMPSKEQQLKEFTNLLDDKKYRKTVKSELENVRNMLVKQKIGSEDQQKRYRDLKINKIQSDEDIKTAYEIFNHAMEYKNKMKSTKEYSRRMSEKYDAMIDDNNQGVYNDAHNPIIIFRANEALKVIGSVPVSDLEIINNRNEIEKYLSKKGRKVQL